MSQIQPSQHENTIEEINVGARLRTIRIQAGMTIRGLAELSGLNVNTLSMIENEKTSPSVSTLQQLAQALQTPISSFFEEEENSRKVIFQKHNQRPAMAFSHGIMQDLAAGMPRFGAEPILVTLKPFADSGRKPIVHTGREFVYCLEGQVLYEVDGVPYEMYPGDSLLFEAYLTHHWKNLSASNARILLVLCPMDSRDQPAERHFGA